MKYCDECGGDMKWCEEHSKYHYLANFKLEHKGLG
jgi:hypothetical protein